MKPKAKRVRKSPVEKLLSNYESRRRSSEREIVNLQKSIAVEQVRLAHYDQIITALKDSIATNTGQTV